MAKPSLGFPIDFKIADFTQCHFDLKHFDTIHEAKHHHIFKGGLTYDDIYWVLKTKYKEEHGLMEKNKEWARQLEHYIDNDTKELIVDARKLEKEIGFNFGIFNIGPINTKEVNLDKCIVRVFNWPKDTVANDEQIKSIKARDWESYIKNFHMPFQYKLSFRVNDKHDFHHEKCGMVHIFAYSNGRVQSNVSDYIFFNNVKHLLHRKELGICKRNSKGIFKITNHKLKLRVYVE